MAPRDQDDRLPEILVIVASVEDAGALAPLAVLDPEVRPVLVATGPDPMLSDGALDDLGALAGRILLADLPAVDPVAETLELMPRLDALVADDAPAAIVVRGGSPTALAAAQVAAWRGIPVVHAPTDAVQAGSTVAAVNHAVIAELADGQDRRVTPSPTTLAVRRLVSDRVDTAGAPRIVGLPSDRARSDLSA